MQTVQYIHEDKHTIDRYLDLQTDGNNRSFLMKWHTICSLFSVHLSLCITKSFSLLVTVDFSQMVIVINTGN